MHITNSCGQTDGMSKPKPARYRTTNWSTYNAALRRRGSLLIWLDKEMAWHAPHEGRPGRPPVFSDAAIPFCLSIKVLFKLPLRIAPRLEPATKSCAPRVTTAGRSGNGGRDTTSAAAPRPGCAASSPSASASPRETPTVRQPKSTSASPSSTVSTPSAPPRSPAWHEHPWGKGQLSPRPEFCNNAGLR